MGLKIWIAPGSAGKLKVNKAIKAINKAVGGKAVVRTSNASKANVHVIPNVISGGLGGHADKIPKNRKQALADPTQVSIDPTYRGKRTGLKPAQAKKRLAMHELGHTLGLGHRRGTLMGQSASSRRITKSQIKKIKRIAGLPR